MFAALTTDDQDSVRLLVVEDCVALGKLLSVADCASKVPIVLRFAADKSWRVRSPWRTTFAPCAKSSASTSRSTVCLTPTSLCSGTRRARYASHRPVKSPNSARSPVRRTRLRKFYPWFRELRKDQSEHAAVFSRGDSARLSADDGQRDDGGEASPDIFHLAQG